MHAEEHARVRVGLPGGEHDVAVGHPEVGGVHGRHGVFECANLMYMLLGYARSMSDGGVGVAVDVSESELVSSLVCACWCMSESR